MGFVYEVDWRYDYGAFWQHGCGFASKSGIDSDCDRAYRI